MYEEYPDDVRIPFQCDKSSYDPAVEIGKYLIQLLYLVPGALLNFFILKTVMSSKHKKIFKSNSFFVIFSMDCIASLYLILVEIFWYRIMRYFMPFCEFFGDLLSDSVTFQRYFYVIYQYARGAKSVIQIFVTVNRMTCVLIPIQHTKFWKYGIRVAVLTTLIVPLSLLYNPTFGRYYPGNVNGGVITRFTRPIIALNLAAIHLTLVIIAIIFTIVCTSITLFGMFSLPHRIKSAEKSLCIASFVHSAAFFVVAAVQLAVALSDSVDPKIVNFLLVLLTFSFDFLNVCTPLIMILVSSQLRSHILPKRCCPSSKVDSSQNVPTMSTGNIGSISN